MADNKLQDEFDQLKSEQNDNSDVNVYINKVDQFMQKLENERKDGQFIYRVNLEDTFQNRSKLQETLAAFVNEVGIEDYLVDNVDAIFETLANEEKPASQYYKLVLHRTGETLPLNNLARFNEDAVIEVQPVSNDDKPLAFKYASDMMEHQFEHSLN